MPSSDHQNVYESIISLQLFFVNLRGALKPYHLWLIKVVINSNRRKLVFSVKHIICCKSTLTKVHHLMLSNAYYLHMRFSSGPLAQLEPSTNSESSWHCIVWQITMLPFSNSFSIVYSILYSLSPTVCLQCTQSVVLYTVCYTSFLQ